MCNITLDEHILSLFQTGIIWVEGNEIVGKASDGTEVCLAVGEGMDEAGNIVTIPPLKDYIAAHPTPDTW